MMLDPADCGPAYIALPQDIAAEAFDYPARSSLRNALTSSDGPARIHARSTRRFERSPPPATLSSSPAAGSSTPGRWHALTDFAERRGIPVTETVAGKSTLLAGPPQLCRTDRCDRFDLRQPPRGGCRCGSGDRNPAPGLHHRLVVGVPQRGHETRRHQRRPLRRPQASGDLGRGRRPGHHRSDRRRPRGLRGSARMAGADGQRFVAPGTHISTRSRPRTASPPTPR